MTFTGDDLEALARIVANGWRSAADRDWSMPAGTLEWTCAKTADHIVDTVLAPAFFLASRKRDEYPDGTWALSADAPPGLLADSLETAARVLSAVVTAADPDVHAIIWRRPVETRPPRDFVPRGALELILHAHDVATGLGIAFEPPSDLVDRLRRHVADWPFWTTPGWQPLTLEGDPWTDLLRASGRSAG